MSINHQKILSALQNLSDQEARLFLGFLEYDNVQVNQLGALAGSYGLSHLRLIKSLISLILKDIVIPKFFLPRNPASFISKVPFPSSFELSIRNLQFSRRERDLLDGIIRRLKNRYESHIESFGFYDKRTTKIRIWQLIEKYYESAPKEELEEYLKKIFSIAETSESPLAWLFLLIWTTYYLSIKRGDISFIDNYWPRAIDRILSLAKQNRLREKIKGILYFLVTSESELFLKGLELPETIRQKIELLKNTLQ